MKSRSDKVLKLLKQASSGISLRLCFHDKLNRSGLPEAWRRHEMPPCIQIKQDEANGRTCVAFDGQEVHKALAGNPDGRIHTCPFGFTEIAVPVASGGLFAGVLFAGPCWTGAGEPPHPQLVRPPDHAWLADRRVLLKAVATELGQLLLGEASYVPADRRRQILAFLAERMERAVTLADLAQALSLSPSRTGHLVREIFDTSFPDLVQAVKLREAARLLSATDHPIGEVAAMVGYEDQNYFARVFARRHGMPPRAYRRRYPAEV